MKMFLELFIIYCWGGGEQFSNQARKSLPPPQSFWQASENLEHLCDMMFLYWKKGSRNAENFTFELNTGGWKNEGWLQKLLSKEKDWNNSFFKYESMSQICEELNSFFVMDNMNSLPGNNQLILWGEGRGSGPNFVFHQKYPPSQQTKNKQLKVWCETLEIYILE